MAGWVYNAKSRRYQDEASGKYLSHAQMLELRDTFADRQMARAAGLAQQLSSGDLTLQQWELAMRQQSKTAFVDQYVLGKGGRGNMTKQDWGRLGLDLANQYDYLRRFAQDISEGKLSGPAIANRAGLYMDASTAAYERGAAAAAGLNLPAHPGDGSTPCKVRCRCYWKIEGIPGDWLCTWVMAASENCSGCKANAAKWSPLKIVNGQVVSGNGAVHARARSSR